MSISSSDGSVSEIVRLLYAVWCSAIIYSSGSQSEAYRPCVGGGALEMGPSERVVRLFTIEMALDQTLGNWYHFFKPTHRINNLLTVR
jgi:hypothetical protein